MLRSDKLIQTLGLPCDSYVSLVNAMSPLRTSVSYGRWRSFLKIAVTMTWCLTLGEHTGEMAAVFTATAVPGAGWSPSQACPDVSLLDRARGPLRSSPGPQVSRTLSLSLLTFPSNLRSYFCSLYPQHTVPSATHGEDEDRQTEPLSISPSSPPTLSTVTLHLFSVSQRKTVLSQSN